jgi:hypothetical protein
MLPKLLAFGAVPARARLALRLLPRLGPHLNPLLDDPGSALRRVGDVLVWEGERGQRVLATLEGLTEGQQRIEAAARGLEAAQLSLASGLGALTSLSLLQAGLTSLAAFIASPLLGLGSGLRRHSTGRTSQTRTVPSVSAEASRRPSGLNARPRM